MQRLPFVTFHREARLQEAVVFQPKTLLKYVNTTGSARGGDSAAFTLSMNSLVTSHLAASFRTLERGQGDWT